MRASRVRPRPAQTEPSGRSRLLFGAAEPHHFLFSGEVDKGAIPGAVLLVARNGKLVYRQAVGYQDREKKIPMKPDAVFRIFSMTKPVATVAVMMLAEEGKIDTLAPVAQYLPASRALSRAVRILSQFACIR